MKVVRLFTVVLLGAPLALAGHVRISAAPLAATQPAASIQTCAARDLPLHTSGARGEMATWLKPFDLPPVKFEYTMQLIEEEDGVQVYRLVFPSPFKSPFPENNVVPAEFYLPKVRAQQIPAAIVLDIMAGNSVVPRGLARGLASQGVAALYMPMAYYNARRPKNGAHVRFLEADPARAVDPPKQTVMDIRRAKAILVSRPEIDPQRVGITGVSLGGIMTAMAAGVDGDFYRVVPILAGGDLAAMIFHAPETRPVRQRLQENGIDQAKLEQVLSPIEPLHFAPRIDPRRCLMINASGDEVIPKQCTMDLWKAAGNPTLLWLPSGHYSAAWFLPTIKQTTIAFLKGEDVSRLRF